MKRNFPHLFILILEKIYSQKNQKTRYFAGIYFAVLPSPIMSAPVYLITKTLYHTNLEWVIPPFADFHIGTWQYASYLQGKLASFSELFIQHCHFATRSATHGICALIRMPLQVH